MPSPTNPDASSIQPGTYNLLLEMKASDAVMALLNPASRATFGVGIPEGLTKDQIATKISEKMAVPVEELQAAVADPAAIGLPAEAGGNAEGWLFPATYDVEPGRHGRERAAADDGADRRGAHAEGRPARPVGDRAQQGVDGRA